MTSLIIAGLIFYLFTTDNDETTFAWILLIALILFGSSEPSPESQTKVTPKPITQQQETLTEH